MTRKKLAIIGNGMATGRLLDELIRRDGLSRFEVTVFGEEPHGCYNRILLNRVVSGPMSKAIAGPPASTAADWVLERPWS